MRKNTENVLTVTGCVLWISGLAAFIIGLNLDGVTGQWVSVAGNIAFLAGLMLVGMMWIKRKKNREETQNVRESGGDDAEKSGT